MTKEWEKEEIAGQARNDGFQSEQNPPVIPCLTQNLSPNEVWIPNVTGFLLSLRMTGKLRGMRKLKKLKKREEGGD